MNCLCAIGKGKKSKTNFLTVRELRLGLTALIQQCQREAFADKLASLEKEKCIGKPSQSLSFTPYLDEDEIICIGGRLDHAKLAYKI